MKLRWLLKVGAIIIIISGGIGVSGCDDPAVYEPEGPTLPFSNQRIISESVLGTENFGSSIYALYEGYDGAIYFRGRIDDSRGIGSTTRQGNMRWWKPMDPSARGLHPVQTNNIGLSEGVVSVT
jgi:hypothetical protein